MFLIFVLAVSLALVFVKLGALSVWVSVLSFAFKIALLIIAGFLVAVIWKKIFPRKRAIQVLTHRQGD